MRRAGLQAAWVAVTVALGVAAAAVTPSGVARAGEVRRVEAVGAVAVVPDAVGPTNLRDGAMRAGLAQGVEQVALALVADLEPLSGEDILGDALGSDPLVYVTRYRILEDRGLRPALFVADPDAESEYVVVVEVQVDVDRVRRRLEENGLLEALPAGGSQRLSLRVAVDGLETHAAYLAVVEALTTEGGARSAMPVEASPGRVVFDVQADRRGPEMLAALLQARLPGLRITPLQSADHRLALRVDWEPPTPAEGALGDGPPD